jgi:lipid II:glycine glycyltransferase (peptidoglycan interpeptide bridge formation enzyme)
MSALKIQVLENIDPQSELGMRWESIVSNNPASGFMQSLHWAAAKRRQGLSIFHLGVFHKEELLGGAIFYTSDRRNGAGILMAPEGPVLPWDDEPITTQALRLLIDSLQCRASELGVMAIRIEPRLAPPIIPALREFGRAPVDLVPRETLYIDLTDSLETLLEDMRPKGRYNIALAERHGVTISQDTTGERLKEFHSIVSEASERDGFAFEPITFFEHLTSTLFPSGKARFIFSQHEEDTIGALLLITYGCRATYLYGGISNKKRNLMGGYALQWQAMKTAKELGCTTYDFYGFDSFRSPEHNYARFSQFKSQFGGRVMRFIGAQDYFFLDNLADAFIKVVNEVGQANNNKLESASSVSDFEKSIQERSA